MTSGTTVELLIQALESEIVQSALKSAIRSAMKEDFDALRSDIKATESRLAGVIEKRPTTSALYCIYPMVALFGWVAFGYWHDFAHLDAKVQSLAVQLGQVDSSLQRVETNQGSILVRIDDVRLHTEPATPKK